MVSVQELRALIELAGLSHNDCVEKSELESRAAEARAVLSDPARQSQRIEETGHAMYLKYQAKGHEACFKPILPEDVAACGGREIFLSMFVDFYHKLMADPEMNVLFDKRHADVDVGADEHGRRLGLWYLARYAGDPEYARLRGGIFSKVNSSHERAVGCPRRGSDAGRGFSHRQRDRWLGYQYQCMLDRSFPLSFIDKMMGLHAGYGMNFIPVAR